MTCNEKSVCLVKTIQIAKFGFLDPPPGTGFLHRRVSRAVSLASSRNSKQHRRKRFCDLPKWNTVEAVFCHIATLNLCNFFSRRFGWWHVMRKVFASSRSIYTQIFKSIRVLTPPLGTENFVKRVLTKSHNITTYYLAYCDWSVGIDWYWSPCCDWPRGRQRHFWLYKRRHWAFFFRVFLLSPVTLSFDSAASRLYVWNLWFLRLFSFWCMPTCLLRWNWVCWLNMLGLRFTSNIRGSLVQCPYSRLAILLRRAISERLRWISLVCL